MAKGTIWHIGGGQMSYPMGLEIKRRGYKLLLTDRDENCYCRKLADDFGLVDVYDEAATLEFAKTRLPKGVRAVLTTGTDAGVEVAVAAEYLGLPGVGSEIARRVRSKTSFRERLNFPFPAYKIVTANESEWTIFPCAVKPDDASGSKGFSLVYKPADLQPAICKAIQANRSSSPGKAIIEEMLIGEDIAMLFGEFSTSEVATDFLVEDGKVHFANAALRLFYRSRPGIEAGHLNPFVPNGTALEMVQRAAEALGVTWGPFKFDLIRDLRYGWVAMEAATRLSGGYDSSYTCPMATGRDVYGAYLDMVLGQPLDLAKLENKAGRAACCLAPAFQPGRISGWKEVDLADTHIFYRTSTEIRPLENNADRPVFIIADGADYWDAYSKARTAAWSISPIYEAI